MENGGQKPWNPPNPMVYHHLSNEQLAILRLYMVIPCYTVVPHSQMQPYGIFLVPESETEFSL